MADTCPDEEMLTSLVEGRLDPNAREMALRHVAKCRDCLDIVGAVLPPATAPAREPQSPAETPTADASPAAVPSRTQPLRTLSARRARTAVAATALAAAAAIVFILGGPVRERATRLVAERVSAALGTRVTLDRIGLGLRDNLHTLTVRLADLRLGDGDQPLGPPADVELAIAIAPLWRGALDVQGVRITRPTIDLALGGAVDLPRHDAPQVRPFGLHDVLGVLLKGPPLTITDGHVTIAARPPLHIGHLAAGSAREGDRTRFAMRGETAGGTVSLSGSLLSRPAVALDVTGTGEELTMADLPDVSRLLTGTADIRMRLLGDAASPRLEGRAVVRGGRLLGGNPIAAVLAHLPPGALPAGLTSDFGGAGLPFDELRLAFAWRDGKWRIPRVFVTWAGGAAGGSLTVSRTGALTGRGTVRIAAALAAPLTDTVPSLAQRRDPDGSLALAFTLAGTLDAPQVAPSP